jgi:hypothetical protein
MGFRFRRRNFGLTPRWQGRQDAPMRRPFLRSEEISARLPAALPATGRCFIWLGIVATIAAGVVYLYLIR